MSTDDFVTDVPRTSSPPRPEANAGAANSAPNGQDLERARFHVDEVADAVEAAEIDDYLADQNGVVGVTVSTIDQSVDIAYDPAEVSPDALRKKIEETGRDTADR